MVFVTRRVLLPYGLLAGLLIGSVTGRISGRDVLASTEMTNLFHRAETAQLPWPCPPDENKQPSASVTDPGASIGVLPYTVDLVVAANEEHGDFKIPSNSSVPGNDETSRSSGGQSLVRRTGFAITQLYIKADTTVATDGGKLIYWQEKDKTLKPSGNSKRTPIKNPEDHIIATADLSGCTVVIVSSPFVALMAHVWERRDEDTWLLEPKGKDQKAKDAEFIAMGEKLLDGLVTLGLGVGASKANQYNGWLPSVSTTVHVVAPASNPDYDNNLGNPWYTYITEKGLIYEDAAKGILSKAAEKFGVPMEYAELHTYRRRYSTDPDHGLDDRDKIVLVPYIYNGHTYVNMMWDDNKLKPIAQIN